MDTFHGSCHCGAVRFRADIDLSAGTMRCNCSFCFKIRCWAVAVRPEHFVLLAGEAEMTHYQFGVRRETHYFCKHCGVRPFGKATSARRGDFYGVSVTCLDDATIDALANAPVTFMDGLHDEWEIPPAETRHL